jgi:hypothetical protein
MLELEGAVAFGDPEKGIGYGFICNQQHNPKELYQTSNLLTYRAIFNTCLTEKLVLIRVEAPFLRRNSMRSSQSSQ